MTTRQTNIIKTIETKLCFGGTDYVKETKVNEESGVCVVTITTGAVDNDDAIFDECFIFCVGSRGRLFKYNANGNKQYMNSNDVYLKCRIY